MSKNIDINNELKNTGIIRRIDELGRLVLPSTLRENYEIEAGDKIQVYVIDKFIILKKSEDNPKIEKLFYRKVDELGRIVIPMEIRNNFELSHINPLEIYIENNYIALKKIENSCTFCNSKKNLIEHVNKLVCSSCIRNLNIKTKK